MSWDPGADVRSANGLRVVVAPAGRSPLVEMRLVLPPVSLLVTDRAEATLLGHCLAEQSRDWTAQMEVEHLVLRTSALPEDLEPTLARLARALIAPQFDQLPMIRARQAAVATPPSDGGLRGELTRAVMRNRFRNHPLSVAAPTAAQLLAVTAGRMREAHARMVVPGGSVLFIAGTADGERTAATAIRELERWVGAAAVFDPKIRIRSPLPKAVMRRDDQCATVVAAAPAPRPATPEFGAALLIAEVLAGGPEARLPRALAQCPGTFVSVSCVLERGVGGAWVSIEADVLNAPADPVVGAIRQCLSGLSTRPPDDQEWSTARAALFRSGVVPLASTAETATSGALALAHGLPWNHWSRSSAVGPTELITVARTFFAPRRFAVAAAGPLGTPRPRKRVAS